MNYFSLCCLFSLWERSILALLTFCLILCKCLFVLLRTGRLSICDGYLMWRFGAPCGQGGSLLLGNHLFLTLWQMGGTCTLSPMPRPGVSTHVLLKGHLRQIWCQWAVSSSFTSGRTVYIKAAMIGSVTRMHITVTVRDHSKTEVQLHPAYLQPICPPLVAVLR